MKEMSLKDIQEVSLEILSVIDKFCLKNNIDYSLGYGSLIGAVRHGGIIPWDDDVDIIMPRPDYIRFCELFNNQIGEQYKLFAPELGNNFHIISRVCEMKKTHVYKYYAWTYEPTGVWIDIFPIDAYPKDTDLALKLWKHSSLSYAVNKSKVIDFSMGLKNLIKNVKRNIKYRNINQEDLLNQYLNLISQIPSYNEALQVCNYGSPYTSKDVHNKSVFNNYQRVAFCSQEVSIISSYDSYLSTLYGEYMQLPPTEKQVRSHNLNKFYWV